MPEEQLAKVTLALLTGAEGGCPRRLELEHADALANARSNGRFQVSNRVSEEIRLAHTDLDAPAAERFAVATPELTAEQRAVYDLAIGWYTTLFDRPVRIVDDDAWSTDLPGDVRLVGRGGLAFTGARGEPELRLLSLDGRPGPPGPLVERPSVRVALLLRARWLDGRTVRVADADLVRGTLDEDDIDAGAAMPAIQEWLASRLEVLRERIALGGETPGQECAWCGYVARCSVMRGRA